MKPPIQYYGAKTTLAARITELLPPHRGYVEPYAGSLAVLLAKPPARMETVNDLDGALMTFWRVLRDRPDDLERVCALTPHSRAEYEHCRDTPTPAGDDIEVARRVWVLLTQGRGSTLRPGKSGWRHFRDPNGSNASMPGYLNGYLARIAPAAARLRSVSLECRPALDVIAAYGQHQDTLLYIDPPYLGQTRNDAAQYRHELADEAGHRDLAEALTACRAAVVLSGYPSDLYDRDLYSGWHRTELATQTGNGATGARARTEVLWSNRPLNVDVPLFDLDEVAA